MQKPRTADQILSDLNAQFPKNTVEEGKQTMARKTKAAAPETVQEDPSRVRRLLQKHQNKKLTPDDFGRMLSEAFGQQVQYQLSKAITAITDNHIVRVLPHHITFDFRGGWGKSVNIRAFIPQNHDGRGVMVRISIAVTNGVWDAKTALQYEDPHPIEGSPIDDDSTTGAGNLRDDAKLPAEKKPTPASYSGATVPAAEVRLQGMNDIESERSGVVYHDVTVETGYLSVGDTGSIFNTDGDLVCPAEVKNIIDINGVVTNLGAGNTAAVEFEYVSDRPTISAGYKFLVTKRTAQTKPSSLAELGRRAMRPLHSRNPTPPSRDGYATVIGAHPHPSGTQYGVRVEEGTLRVADVLQIWRDGRFHTGAHLVAISREGGEAIQILLMGEQAGVFLNIPGITDLKSGDEIYVVDRAASVEMGSMFSNITFEKDARGDIATIWLEGMTQKQVVDIARSALVTLRVPVTEIANANSAVMQLLEGVRNSNMGDKAGSLTIEWLHQDEFYPRAVRAVVQFGEKRDSCGLGTVFIADGQARRNLLFGVGTLSVPVADLDKPIHGLAAYFSLSSFLGGLDVRDRADFEHAWLETHKLGLAEQVVFRQSRNQVMEVWVEKHKYAASGRLVATLEFGNRGVERFHFHEVESSDEQEFDFAFGGDGMVLKGPFESSKWERELVKHYGNLSVNISQAMHEIKRVATEALIDNPEHWADDQIVPWGFEVHQKHEGFIVVKMVCLRDEQAAGFALELTREVPGILSVSPVYGYGRFTNLLLLKGIHLTGFFASTVLTQHLVSDDIAVTQKLLDELGSLVHPKDIVALHQVPERNAMMLVRVKHYEALMQASSESLVEFDLINGRIVSWKFPKARAAKQQPQPHRHHQMDSEHATTSIVPRPRPNGDICNLHQVQVMIFMRQLFLDDEQKLGTLQDFVEGVVANARDGGTENALLFSLLCRDSEISVFAQYIDTGRYVRNIAKTTVYL